jgi:hypothetical protein
MTFARLSAAIFVAAIAVVLFVASAFASTRVCLMRGLGGIMLSNSMDVLGQRMRRAGAHVIVTGWWGAPLCEADALAHPRDRNVIAGHSMGAAAAGAVGTDLKARGVHVKVIGIDPLYTGASVGRGVDAVAFYGQGFAMGGARNSFVASSYGHVAYAADPRVQARVMAAAMGGRSVRHRARHVARR